MLRYVATERPADVGTDRLFVVPKRQRRAQPLSAYGIDEILADAATRSA